MLRKLLWTCLYAGLGAGATMAKADQTIDSAADKLQGLAEDTAFLRKLEPSLIAARARGKAPTDQKPGSGTTAPSGPQLGTRPKKAKPKKHGGPNPWLVAGAALVAGIALAKWIDWRGHAHPRD